MKYENISWVCQSWMDPILNSRKHFYQVSCIAFLFFSSSFMFGQCANTGPDRVCTNIAATQTLEIDLLNLDCDNQGSTTISSLGAGGLYKISLAPGASYNFSLIPLDSDVSGQMELFSDEAQTIFLASSGPAGNTNLTPTELNYTNNANLVSTEVYLAVWSHTCLGNWDDFELTINCTTCAIICDDFVSIGANETGCVSAASTFDVPTTTGTCDISSVMISDDGGTGATIPLGSNEVLFPAEVPTGTYTIEFSVLNCAGMAETCTTNVLVAPTSGCVSTNVNLSPGCETPLNAGLLLKNMCGSMDDYTLFIDGVEATSVSEAGTFDISVKYTPTSNPSIAMDLCWAPTTFEDKSGPSCNLSNDDTEYNFVCGFETATATPTFTDCSGTVTANDVVQLTIGNCGEVDGITDGDNDLFNDLPITTMGVTIPVPTEAEAGTLNGASFALERVIVNSFTASDGQNTGTACEQFIYIFRPTVIATPGSAFITCGLETTPTALAAIDPQLVPYYVNPLYGADNSTMNDFSGMGVEDPDFMPTMVDDNGNPQFVAIAGQDHSVCSFVVTSDDTPTSNPCGLTTKFVRRYTVLNCCTSQIVLDDAAQFVETVDNIAPEFSDCPANGELGTMMNPRIFQINDSNTCSTSVDFAAIRPTVTDACSDELASPITYSATFFLVADDFSDDGTVVAFGMNPTLDMGSYRVEVVATDDCGNISMTCLVFLRVEDNVVPTVSCTINAVSVDGNGNAEVCAADFASANDNCDNIASLEVRLMEQDDSTFDDCITVNCNDAVEDSTGMLVFNLVFRATDASGNSNTVMCPAELQIQAAPAFTCPDDVTVECGTFDSTMTFGEPTVGGQCGQMFTTSFSDSPFVNPCSVTGTMVRTFMLSMNGTVVATCDQNITLEDTTDPTFDNPPADTTAECDNIPDGSGVTASDECTTATVTFVDVSTDGDCTNSFTLARTFTATDECSNTATFTQMIMVDDTTMPTFIAMPSDITVGCNNVPPANPIAATDNCDTNVTVTVDDSAPIDNDNCPNNDTFIRTFTATDNCDNSTVITQMITILPNPIQVTAAPDTTLDCSFIDEFMFTEPTVVEDSSCTSTEPMTTGPAITRDTLDNGDIRVIGTFTVTDNCGITASVSTTAVFTNCCPAVSIQADIISCSAISGSVTIDPFTTFNGDINDLTFRLIDGDGNQIGVDQVGNDVFTFTPADIDGTEYISQVFFIDPGINAMCPGDQAEPVSCTAPRIAGRIFNEEFIPLEEVEVELMNTEIPMSMTNENGEYSFEGLAEQAYSIAAHKEEDPFNGISTFDLVMMAQHVLGIQELGSPYKLIAADINMDETIDILDMVELRQLILFSIENFTVNTSWRFVNANYIFPDPTNPWLETIPQLHNLEAPRTDTEHDFIAVKIGDLDCSAETSSNLTELTPRDNKTLVLETKHQTVSAGTTFEVALQPNQDVNLSALQFTLDFDPSLATLVSVSSSVLEAQDIAVNEKFAQEGKVPFVWYTQQNVQLDADQEITLSFEAKHDLDLVDLLDINSSMTEAAAYSEDGIGYNISLQLLDQLELNSTAKYTLYQNTPNPFQSETVIGFDIAQDEEVKFTVFNLEGKVLYSNEFTAQAGYNAVVINKEEIQATGVLFYQLDAADYTTTKKMIILD